jgi:alpha-glucoside transport system permease protein
LPPPINPLGKGWSCMAIIVEQKPLPPRRKPRRETSRAAWIWIAPTLFLEIVFFLYPVFNTIQWSFENNSLNGYVGFRNYARIATDPGLLEVLRNNLIWLILGTLVTVGLGLIIAVLVDRIKIESMVKSMLFVPMAISFVGAGVIWRMVYDYQTPDKEQTGLFNAVLAIFHIPPQTWLIDERFNNLALILVYVWMTAGFSMVILSAALKGIPDEIIEAARMDGASRFTLFWRIMIPMISSTIGVVVTTVVIGILKIFDVVYVMTGGNYGTDVIARRFYDELFQFNNYGLASALAALLLLTVIPVMYINVRRIRQEEKIR